ncbi:60S ribosomal protein L31 [Candidatus Woesearchaeota archaeon]|nr:60S ribosomal protein L31 [Candidatus Woesearchaeota archaeon]
MAEERIYTIPLRKEWLKVPVYKRSRKAITATKQFLFRHLKKEVNVGPYLNEYIWKQGNRHPPARVKIRIEDEKGKLTAELINAPRKEIKKEDKEDIIKIKKPEFLKKKEEKEVKVVKDEGEKEKIAEEKKEIDKKAIEKVPVDKLREREEKEMVKSADTQPKSLKKEGFIPTEKSGQIRKD